MYYFFLLFNTKNRTEFTNKIVFTKAIEELEYLQHNGISITVGNEKKQLFFALILISGDNLGLRSVLGYVESCSANLFCRFCLTEHKNLKTIFNEHDCILRNPENYDTLLSKNNVSVSGIKKPCVFNRITNFHPTSNLSVDPQHDIQEGILRYDVALAVNNLIYQSKFFTLEDLNLRLAGFQYGVNDHANKPMSISEAHLKNGCLIMSAAEMMNLFRCIFLFVGPFVPQENSHWQLLIKLKQIVEIVFSKVIHDTT